MRVNPIWILSRAIGHLWAEMEVCPMEDLDAIADASDLLIDARQEVWCEYTERQAA